MAAIAEGEIIRFERGPLPVEIFAYEPCLAEGKEHPTPTLVTKSIENGSEASRQRFEQELNEEGRVIGTRLNGKAFLVRTWSGMVACRDKLADGTIREITTEYISPMRSSYTLNSSTQKPTSLWFEQYEKDEDSPAGKEVGVSLRGLRGATHTARLSPDGRIQTEYEWLPYDFEEGFSPRYRSKWEFDNEGKLQKVVTPGRGMSADSVLFQYPLVERYQQVSDKALSVVEYLSPENGNYPLIGRRQHREYDSEGRVVAIRSQVCVPESRMHTANIELSYD